MGYAGPPMAQPQMMVPQQQVTNTVTTNTTVVVVGQGATDVGALERARASVANIFCNHCKTTGTTSYYEGMS